MKDEMKNKVSDRGWEERQQLSHTKAPVMALFRVALELCDHNA